MKITYADTGDPVRKVNPEYLRRNLLHCKAVGVYYGIKAIFDRLHTKAQTRAAKWLMKILAAEMAKAEVVHKEMSAHRDEVEVYES